MTASRPLRVLVCPLDWGLGHATRCVPVINELQQLGCEVMVASCGGALDLLKLEFPDLKFFTISSYQIDYSDSRPLIVHLAFKVPKILSVIRKEHREIGKLVAEHAVDFIVSDNRYGCYHKTIPSAIITHQLNIRMPKRWSWISGMVNKYNSNLISRFQQCWVPDTPDHHLSGDLSANSSLPHKYIGTLSRMQRKSERTPKFDVLALLSGPEPQRTTLERIVLDQLRSISQKTGLTFKLVRGTFSRETIDDKNCVNHLPAAQLNQLIENSKLVVSRPGYSTIMDLAALGKKAILVPTPGQTEQEYLAETLHAKKIAMMVQQHELKLSEQLKNIDNFTGFSGRPNSGELLNLTLREFLLLK